MLNNRIKKTQYASGGNVVVREISVKMAVQRIEGDIIKTCGIGKKRFELITTDSYHISHISCHYDLVNIILASTNTTTTDN